MSVLFSKWKDREGKDLTERFEAAKQVLTMLLGILGTIVGFYFGTTTDDAAPSFAITDVAVSDLTPDAGTSFTLTATLEGGKSPFGYSVNFHDDEIQNIADQQTEKRTIQHEVSLEDATPPKDLGITLTVTDAEGEQQTYEREPGTWVKVQEPPPLTIAGVTASNLRPLVGDENFTLTVALKGGNAPFDYSIEFTPPETQLKDTTGQTDAPSIQEIVSLESIESPTNIGVTVTVSDVTGTKVMQQLVPGQWVQVIEPPTTPLGIESVLASTLTPKTGESFTLTVTLAGGKAPFQYTADFDASEIDDIVVKDAPERTIQREVSLENVTEARDIGVTVTVVDDNQDEAKLEHKPGTWVKVLQAPQADTSTRPKLRSD